MKKQMQNSAHGYFYSSRLTILDSPFGAQDRYLTISDSNYCPKTISDLKDNLLETQPTPSKCLPKRISDTG